MMRKTYNVNEKKSQIRAADFLRLLPLVVFISVVFLLVRVESCQMPLSQFPYMAETDDTVLYDCFSRVKMHAVITVTIVSIVLLSFYLITGKRRIRKNSIYVPMMIYISTIVISYIQSDYKEISLFGTCERFEGTIVHLCYLFMLFYAINCIDSIFEVRMILDTLFAGIFIACLIGLSQYIGCDFFSWKVGEKMLLGNFDKELTFNFQKGQVYQTVYNINYVPFYLCMVIPVLISCIIDMLRKFKNVSMAGKVYTLWLVSILLLIFVNIVGADSVGSLPGVIFAVTGAALVRLDYKRKRIGLFCVALVYLSGTLLAGMGVFGDALSLFVPDNSERPNIGYIKTYGDSVEFLINDKRFVTDYDRATGGFFLTNGEGRELWTFQFEEDKYTYEFNDDDFGGIISFAPIYTDDGLLTVYQMMDEQWIFEYTDAGVKYLNGVGSRVNLDKVEHAGFIKNYSFGSGRGYIWDTTIPLLRDKLFWGSGADTYMMEFPQDDYAVRYSHGQAVDCVFDKPHNMYLQMAVSFGIVGMIVFVMMILRGVVPILKKKGTPKLEETLGESIAVGIIAFLIAALVNDSSIHVMPMFYGLFGCMASGIDIKEMRTTVK